jgi:6-pyruvoyltetrahydropterin/6-carboxytetrahydropterin synthase
MFEVETSVTFEAAHMITGHPKCGKLHGHTWSLTACLRGDQLGQTSEYAYLVDFGEIKAILRELAPDHAYLNEVYSFAPTSEELARHFYSQIRGRLQVLHLDRAVELAWVQVSEGLNNHARFYIAPTDRSTFKPFREAGDVPQTDAGNGLRR